MWREPVVWVDHHAGRITSFHPPHGQFGIVLNGGADSDDYRIHIRPEPMKVVKCATPVDPTACAGRRGNSSVERLSELRDNERPVGRSRQQGLYQRVGIGLTKIVVVYRH